MCTFGRRILDGSGEINRSKLGHIVFDSPDDLRALNELIHPTIVERVEAEIEQKLSSAKHAAIVIDAALLIELDLTSMVDSIVLVTAEEGVQIQRLMKRGLSREDAQKRIHSQMSSYEKERFADFIIRNNGPLSDMARRVRQVWDALIGTACTKDEGHLHAREP